jgi:two-component system, LytTR family, response regulator
MEQAIRILIADDEAPARGELEYMLKTLMPQARFYEATNGEQALTLVEREPIQVVFLDINMPGIDGLTVAATIMDNPEPPLIVFATAYNEHSVRAFELAALDYVVKPFDERRLAKTVERIRHTLEERAILAEKQTALRTYLAQAAPVANLTKLWCERANASRVLVNYHDILWIVAEMKDVFAQTTGGEKLRVRSTLKDLEPRLSQHHFARVHKAYLVNLDHIGEVAPWFSGAYVIHMADAAHTEIPMSRRYAIQLKKLTGWE